MELFIGLVVFTLVSAFTPGPNNLMVLASGVNFGFRRTLPHIFGVGVGFLVMLGTLGLGLGQLFTAVPVSLTVLKIAAVLYLGFLAFKLATSGSLSSGKDLPRPLGFVGAALFQWLNPKAWIAAITVLANYTLPKAFLFSLGLTAAVNFTIAVAAVSTWTLFGTALKNLLTHPTRLKIFNITMALLLILSILPSVFAP